MTHQNPDLQIVDFEPKYQPAFKQLNQEWITTWFKMETNDHQSLDHPDDYILSKGGHIYIALYRNEPVGACALIKTENDAFEMAKMAVSPKARGKGIGYLLGRHCIEQAKQLGANKLYLESNTVLEPAIALYHKLGFKKITGIPSPYERCNIQMEMDL
ncbi:GNAT family N-acetyltransferase [Mucilaginibacter glaciei]|nr:GNAT family N-acetyltransferase [Mucilaginibacter glaciei]